MSVFSAFDYQMMSKAIALAKRGVYTTTPNPNVGCVLAKAGQIVGEGYHVQAGGPHAEVHALRQAGAQAKGATAYVTLEPCSHYGRTPPCAEGLIQAGVVKVICAMQDPNPQVAGRGIAMLQAAGIEVLTGLLEADANALNPAFLKRMKTGMPWVQLKMAASLDGQTALANGVSQWITSVEARADVQKFRAKASAILSTSQTVIADDAALTVRHQALPESVGQRYPLAELRQPVRIILDQHHRLHAGLKLYDGDGAVLTVGQDDADICVALDSTGKLDLRALLCQLADKHQINHLWVEAGATLSQALLSQQLVDEIILYLAPKLMGSDGRGLFGQFGFESMQDVFQLDIADVVRVGPDIRMTVIPQYHSPNVQI
ncbi:bifunctional diaminohydroxyphosphoribosylaminopyrimidine deaminase/5-amino-6-(5-phosphoribosylamino)uracil reductase RibD [Vibrio gazogenes]|uniref:Riboflavin biosynthesis protein RibD n=1 Tax=Vibrio gazogenes DSM 21264 = NBRC 103151 TaxID=1123492 RepID=A0A1M4X0J7_VIBGA|nr:bifunctional diaminohydroxyphosphoribosylaminopyrimidine deaminase/5-amino-6-(5-phosphoribosylamino)uracil reductase RibD [Vibrio gazogenes]USP13060.1 bifunctional diaminohydroxyphosphoribosylaminopyrimidine deaminase/5-amino-6-(5-phosphoribosylamino)uracil reductase RibD [Vibrio gazogenes]SHE87028.1 diaminohydroxyphosphoribosylaminopyrimidine deaminase [Vibrio gazogenes DSM 21264] [Vibrio gazogenes DSM 21264 = NBRC 103151]SJN57161.1 Riboflavin biosynthesis protein RibD [Vibrio gazogenes]